MIGEEPDWRSNEAQMILTVHNLAKTYKMLPSEALGRASTFDLFVLDTFHRYQRYQENKQKTNPSAPIPRQMSQDEMKSMLKRMKDPKFQEQLNAKIRKNRR